uniref:FBA_1 domain-containing protein n=1 Tax=Heterorhabditis bacteriophora TaxID=37862 RepID=A0A1I7XRC3_HETBA
MLENKWDEGVLFKMIAYTPLISVSDSSSECTSRGVIHFLERWLGKFSSTHRNKTCPDFKADPSFVYCCTSKLPPTGGVFKEKHGVFCCSLSDFEKERQEQADEEFKSFMKE